MLFGPGLRNKKQHACLPGQRNTHTETHTHTQTPISIAIQTHRHTLKRYQGGLSAPWHSEACLSGCLDWHTELSSEGRRVERGAEERGGGEGQRGGGEERGVEERGVEERGGGEERGGEEGGDQGRETKRESLPVEPTLTPSIKTDRTELPSLTSCTDTNT